MKNRFFLDTEFIEGFRKPLFGKRRHFIDLISIGIVDDTGREFYAISKEFDLDYAWKDEWVRENVLRPLHTEMCQKESTYGKTYFSGLFQPFTKRSMRNLLRWQGKTEKQIADEIRQFVYAPALKDFPTVSAFYGADGSVECWLKENQIAFYGYYADYDWVLLCSLFGRMIDLPKGFPMYCDDLKQGMDSVALLLEREHYLKPGEGLVLLKKRTTYPEQKNEHHALADAKWNCELFGCLNFPYKPE